MGPRNALHFNKGSIQKKGLKFLLFKLKTLTVQMFSLFFCSFHHCVLHFYLFIYLPLALSYCCESDFMDWLAIPMFDVAKPCCVSLETTKTSLIYYINYCWELALEQFMKGIIWRNCLQQQGTKLPILCVTNPERPKNNTIWKAKAFKECLEPMSKKLTPCTTTQKKQGHSVLFIL